MAGNLPLGGNSGIGEIEGSRASWGARKGLQSSQGQVKKEDGRIAHAGAGEGEQALDSLAGFDTRGTAANYARKKGRKPGFGGSWQGTGNWDKCYDPFLGLARHPLLGLHAS